MQPGQLGRPGPARAHGNVEEHPGVGLAQADGPPSAVLGQPEGGAGGVEAPQRVVEQAGGDLRGVHPDLDARPAGGVPRRGQALVEGALDLRDDLEAGRQPGAWRAVEGQDAPAGGAGRYCVERVS